MKTIPVTNYTDAISTRTVLKGCLDYTPQNGLDFAQIRGRLRVGKAIEDSEATTEINLEDADYAIAQSCVKETRWVKPEPYLIQFAELFGL